MKRKITLFALLICFLSVVGFFVTNQKIVAKFWVEQTSKPNKSFEEYSQMTNLKERIVAVNKETPKNKSILWRQNFIYHANHMNLTQEQKTWVEEASDFVDENFFTLIGGNESDFIKTDLGKSYEKLMIRKSELFTREQAMKFCLIIGDDSTLINSEQESNVSESGVYCNCTASLCPQCSYPDGCNDSNCLTASDNCGCFAVWNCTKKCTVGLPENQ